MAQVIRSPKIYDVCIIGSGAAGGTAAKVLTEGGLNVVMLEAGPPLNPEKDFKEHLWPYQLPHRGVGIGGNLKHELNDEFMAPNGAGEIEGEPYTVANGSRFRWFRSRIVGGRTNHWGRIALRFAPVDFKARSTDGMGDDWPITYEELAPYYDKVESYIGVFGTKENIPSAPDGVFLPPPQPRCTELLIKKSCDKLKVLCVPPLLEKMPRHNHDGVGGMHVYIPWWKFDRKNEFLRGYHMEIWGGQGMPGPGEFDGVCTEFEGYGAALKQKCRTRYGTFIGIAGR